MSENEPKSSTGLEQAVAKVFEAAGYEVSQRVGTLPGEVDWFARPYREQSLACLTGWLTWQAVL